MPPELLNPKTPTDQMADSSDNSSNSNVAQGSGPSLPTIGAQLSTLATDERSDIGHLSDEMLLNIAQNCQGEHRVATLRNLCMVSRRMDSIARQELYRTISADTWPRLRRLWRTIEEHPALGQYIVELEFLVPGYTCTTQTMEVPDRTDLSMLYSLFLGILKATTNLRKLNIMLLGAGRGPWAFRNHQILHNEFVTRLCNMDIQSQSSESAPNILPLLVKVRLGGDGNWKDPTVYRRLGLAQPFLFLPFLHLPSISSLESIDDSGIWPRNRPDPLSAAILSTPSAFVSETPPSQQIKSVILRESNSTPMDIMHICNMFPDMQTFFCQNRLIDSVYDPSEAHRLGFVQRYAAPSEKRYLTDSFGKLRKLQALAFVPLLPGNLTQACQGRFLSPSGFLKLTGIPGLTSLATLVSAFACPDGETTGLMTPGPMEVLPSSLRSLQLIVDHWTCRSLANTMLLTQNWFQPREAALRFLSALASICATAFPALRQVEYIWAVDRSYDVTDLPNAPQIPEPEVQESHWQDNFGLRPDRWNDIEDAPRPCDGMRPLCCSMHKRIQALSPDEDYTSRAEGIVSPFKDRFDGLAAAFNEANVVFRVVELKEYSDFYSHWQGSRE